MSLLCKGILWVFQGVTAQSTDRKEAEVHLVSRGGLSWVQSDPFTRGLIQKWIALNGTVWNRPLPLCPGRSFMPSWLGRWALRRWGAHLGPGRGPENQGLAQNWAFSLKRILVKQQSAGLHACVGAFGIWWDRWRVSAFERIILGDLKFPSLLFGPSLNIFFHMKNAF